MPPIDELAVDAIPGGGNRPRYAIRHEGATIGVYLRARLATVDPAQFGRLVRALGYPATEADGAVRRLTEITKAGRITGEAWHGVILDKSKQVVFPQSSTTVESPPSRYTLSSEDATDRRRE
jgi:hypothetical protein